MGFEIKYHILNKYIEEPGITEVTIPDDVMIIESAAFSHFKSLTSINISDSVRRIRGDAFSGCEI